MAHIELAGEGVVYSFENLRDRILALGLLAEHVFLARWRVEVHAGHARTLLTAVVLLLHHQIELVQSVAPRAVLLLVVAQRLQQADHRHTTFMLQLFHRYMLL